MIESLKQFRDLYDRNMQIISRIEQTKYITTFSYECSWGPSTSTPVLEPSVREHPIKMPLEEFLSAWTLKPEFTSALQRVPNDPTVVWDMSSWSDMRTVHQRVAQAVSFMEQVGATGERAEQTMSVYASNLKILQKALYETEEESVSERSQLNSRKKKILEAARAFNEAVAQARGPFTIPTPTTPDFHNSKTLGKAQARQLVEWFGSGWQLLYRASEDGWDSRIFHELCDGKGPTLTVGVASHSYRDLMANYPLSRQVASNYPLSRQVAYGGYTAVPWRSQDREEVINDDESCLFVLDELVENKPALFRVSESRRQCHTGPIMSNGGPAFGRDYVGIRLESEQLPFFAFLRGDGPQQTRFSQENISSAYIKVTSGASLSLANLAKRCMLQNLSGYWEPSPSDLEVYGRITSGPPFRTRLQGGNEPNRAISASAASGSRGVRGSAA
uniref:TLDc domain-containing protein n=1 Tax=Chromera velia CCMP2878 TaxID=1169474 RepID=A0A0G4HSK2_9ALVE|eukprot:Cvel_30989.t1-p1 / transcript=Cvel_30989.t1 / gene=Cvel_30989 / organism=Chromera_velia_CCMP2878 / gene_product=hypothetical protein / transcript_product=hypothetical protein / location=Cvel_scaffold4528:2688-4019(-) / protein_length=444 / sequence_SO=supercontig / SO=protein_coding / is_pseudo=false